MSVAAAFPSLFALIWGLSQPSMQEVRMYDAAATFRDGECWFWTGDVGLTAQQFREDLRSRFDRQRGIVIRHTSDTPSRCVELARRSAIEAGFTKVMAAIDAGAGAIGPPSSGS